jgi:regulator of protease activity HflC (stomatin/prohibitin superfamily)
MKTISTLIVVALLLAAGWLTFDWTVNRVYVPEGQSLLLRYKGPFFLKSENAKRGHWAEEGQVGVLRQLRGPGRHFYSPIWWERKIVPDVVIEAGEVGVVTCLLGNPLPKGEFLVPGDIGKTEFKGVLRKVLGPGRYRINPYGYDVKKIASESVTSGKQIKHYGWVDIPTGYVGVITNLTKNDATGQKAGIQPNVLPPGLYPINGREQQIDIVEIGYRETTVAVKKLRNPDGSLQLDKAGEPLVGSEAEGINFPSSDGFPIQMDFTAVWGVMPDQAPHAVRTFGNIAEVENKVVQPQIESICRNNGSKYKAVEMLVGEDREKFQQTNLVEFKQVLNEKKITLLYGLVRHIYIPQEIREPIQFSNVADELKLTREQEQLTAQAEALYRQAERNVELESERVKVDTERQFGSRLADGDRESKTIDAQTARMVAKIEKETAELKAQATEVLGRAENEGKQMVEEAKADRFRLAVEAFGTPAAYNDWIFAENLPDNVELKLLYAGEGTLWTDMDNVGVRANVPLKKPSPKK